MLFFKDVAVKQLSALSESFNKATLTSKDRTKKIPLFGRDVSYSFLNFDCPCLLCNVFKDSSDSELNEKIKQKVRPLFDVLAHLFYPRMLLMSNHLPDKKG